MYYSIEYIKEGDVYNIIKKSEELLDVIRNINNIIEKCKMKIIMGKDELFERLPYNVIISLKLEELNYGISICYIEEVLNYDLILPLGNINIEKCNTDYELANAYNDVSNHIEYFILSKDVIDEKSNNIDLSDIIYRLKNYDTDLYSEINMLDTLSGPYYNFLKVICKRDNDFLCDVFRVYLKKFLYVKEDGCYNNKDDIINNFYKEEVDGELYGQLLCILDEYMVEGECYELRVDVRYDLSMFKMDKLYKLIDDESDEDTDNEYETDYDLMLSLKMREQVKNMNDVDNFGNVCSDEENYVNLEEENIEISSESENEVYY